MAEVMIDLETLGRTVDAVITSIGAVRFDQENGISATFKTKVQAHSQPGRELCPKTIMWWMQQDVSARGGLVAPTPVELKVALKELTAFVQETPLPRVIWANGVTFDLAILRDAYKGFPPWGYREEMCLRPIRQVGAACLGMRYGEGRGSGWHDALDDARAQAEYLIAVRRAINRGEGYGVR